MDSTAVGDEGGCALVIDGHKDVFMLLVCPIEQPGYTDRLVIGADAAVSGTLDRKSRKYNTGFKMPEAERIRRASRRAPFFVDSWVYKAARYPVWHLEDTADENDLDSRAALTAKIEDKNEIEGDDWYGANSKIVAEGSGALFAVSFGVVVVRDVLLLSPGVVL